MFLRLLLAGVILGLGLAATQVPPSKKPLAPWVHFLPPQTATPLPPQTFFLPVPPNAPSSHAVTAIALPPNQLLAIWYAGSREGAQDVALYQSRFEQGHWNTPQRLTDAQRTQEDTQRFIKKVGNPVLGRDALGRLHLFYVSVSVGGWAGSALNHLISKDEGKNWSKAQRLITSPFLNLSTLVRTPPLARADGGLSLPIYHELIARFPEWLEINAQGEVVSKTRIPNAQETIQPAAVVETPQKATLFLRNMGHPQAGVLRSTTDTTGKNWQPPTPTGLPNPNAAISVIALSTQQWVMALNPQTSNRNTLALYRSQDQGQHWHFWKTLAHSDNPQDEFSYPHLVETHQALHVFYTWKRQMIRHEVHALP